jgi:hypothetical protein
MNDVKDLLELALTDRHGLDPAQHVDPAGDLARGRGLLRRRRLVGVAGAATAVVVVALVPWAIHAAGSGPAVVGQAAPTIRSAPRPSSTGPAPTHPAAPSHSIALVAYEGKQPPGYQVAEVPSGWVVQGGNAYALVLAPKDDKDTSIDSFIGKLVVMLQSQGVGAPTVGTSLPVAGRPGRFDVQYNTQILTYQGADGRWVVIQAPTSLGWDSARLAQFAAGVQVLGNAQPGQG